MNLTSRRQQFGFNMIEVLVAVAVLAIGLLGIAALQVQGVRYNYGSFTRSIAVMLANDYAERMYANRPGVNLAAYGDYNSTAVDCDTAPERICATQLDTADPEICTAQEMADYDRYVVACGFATTAGRYGGVNDLLTSGSMTATCIDVDGADAACAIGLRHVITVSWQERGSTSDSSTEVQTVNYQMTIQP